MRKKIISLILGLFVGASSFLAYFVPTAQAVVPIGFAQAALASYVSSTGYKMYQDQAVGDSILLSLSELYDLFRENTLQGAATDFALDTLLTSFQIRQDNSGNVVVSKMAADVFQQFADWIQTEYSIPDNSSIPTEVLAAQPGYYTNNNGVNCWLLTDFPTIFTEGSTTINYNSRVLGSITYQGTSQDSFLGIYNSPNIKTGRVYITRLNGSTNNLGYCVFPVNGHSNIQYSFVRVTGWPGLLTSGGFGNTDGVWKFLTVPANVISNLPLSTVAPSSVDDLVSAGGVSGLAMSLAQTVVDQAAKAKDDDAVVIGVGAQAGATAQEIADLIVQGINARTLDPSVTVVAEVAIDTPVQQFPDQDDLGLPKLGLALVRRFPFCIPFDLVDTWQAIVHAPVPPTMTIDLIPASIKAKIGITADTSFILNLASPAFATLLFILRWACIISFCLALEQLTKRYIWTTGG